MTNPPVTPSVYPIPQGPSLPPQQTPKKNVLGIIAFIVAVVGFIFACIPGALIIGWVLLPIAFILAIVSLFMKGTGKGFGITGLIISVVGTLVGVIVFVALVASAVGGAFSSGATTVTQPDGEVVTNESTGEAQGTRSNPYPIGTAVHQGDWTVTVNSVNLDATEEITAENLFNEAPDAGFIYILVNVTATYSGSDPDGSTPWLSLKYVTVDGNTISGTEKLLVAPNSFDRMGTMYEGASVTGNFAFQVPAETAAEGTLALTPTMMGDKVFVAVS